MKSQKEEDKQACFGCENAEPLYRWSPLGFFKIHCAILKKDINEQGACIVKESDLH